MAQNRPQVIRSIIALDPVDSAGAFTAGDTMALDNPLPQGVKAIVVGMGLASQGAGLFSPPCAPEDSNYTEFFSGASSPSWQILVSDGGHLDFLDSNPQGCGLECTQCTVGGNPTGGRLLAGGLTVAAAKGDLNGIDAAWDAVSDTSEHPVSTLVQSK